MIKLAQMVSLIVCHEPIPIKVIGSSGESKDIEPREAVLVTFEGRIANNRSIVDGPLFQRAESWLIVVGESDVVSALDMVRTSNKPWMNEPCC